MDVQNLDAVVAFEVLSEFGNVYVHASPVEIVRIPPNVAQSVCTLEQGVLVFAKHKQQLVFLGGESMGLAI